MENLKKHDEFEDGPFEQVIMEIKTRTTINASTLIPKICLATKISRASWKPEA